MRRSIGLFLLLAAVPARAEWFGDIYGGMAYTPRSDITIVVGSPSGPADHTFYDVKWDKSPVFGARAGYWFDSLPWYGIGLDVFRFNADVSMQTVDTKISGVTAPAALQAIDFQSNVLAFDVVRLRHLYLPSAEHPQGRLQLDATAGPALFRTTVTNRANGEFTTQPATDTSRGYKLGGGASWRLTRRTALFAEYRFTHVRTEPVLRGTITGANVPMPFDLDTHHLVAGASFRF